LEDEPDEDVDSPTIKYSETSERESLVSGVTFIPKLSIVILSGVYGP
jgi:hypothetical protein